MCFPWGSFAFPEFGAADAGNDPSGLARGWGCAAPICGGTRECENKNVDFLEKLRAFGRGLNEFYAAPYRSAFLRAQREEEDLFMLLVLGEALGVPNPAAFYTLELLPIIYEDFHAWHQRMGMEHSPLENIRCC